MTEPPSSSPSPRPDGPAANEPGRSSASRPAESSFVLGLLRDWGIAVAVVLGVFVGYNVLFRPGPPPLGPAPDFVLTDLEGKRVTLSEAGDLVVLNFWFTNCPPCRREIPELSQWHQENPDVPLYGVSTDVGVPTTRLAADARRLGITYPVLHDHKLEVARQYAVDTFPTTLVIKDGHIVQAKIGMIDKAMLAAMVDRAR